MGRNSAIEWCHHTFNPWIGCSRVSPGCANCYAEARDKRFNGGKHWGPGAPRRVTSPANWRQPLLWNRKAEAAGERQGVFCGSLCDVFDPEAPEGAFDWLSWLIGATESLDWLLLTKRLERAYTMLVDHDLAWLQNVWVGTTVENQEQADRRIPELQEIPARVRFLSVEPMLGPVDLELSSLWEGTPKEYISWIICGGESGPKARPMHPDWARSIRDQCAAVGVPFLFKQQGEWAPAVGKVGKGESRSVSDGAGTRMIMRRVGKKAAGRLLDGVEHTALPQGGP